MEIIESSFLFLSIFIPVVFIVMSIFNYDKVRKSRKSKSRIITAIVVSFILNFSMYKIVRFNLDGANQTREENIVEKSSFEEVETDKDVEIIDEDSKNEYNQDDDIEKSDTITENGFNIEHKDGGTYIDGYLIVNKSYPLDEDYIPSNTHKKITKDTSICAECLVEDAYNAFEKMREDASKDGCTIWVQSGYRSYNYQKTLYAKYVKKDSIEKADTYSAREGYSEHQSGYAIDLNSVNLSFENTKESKWINKNAYKYGFIVRYPKGKEKITGYTYEPWHIRYVGEELASELYNNGDWQTLEEYFGITSQYREN